MMTGLSKCGRRVREPPVAVRRSKRYAELSPELLTEILK
jgi:hypothetical protein